MEYREATIPDEEVCELSRKLKNSSAEDALKILKYLDDKALTFQQLKLSLIGKSLGAVNPEVPHDSELSSDLSLFKRLLLTKWK
jgi:hypothetical protein